MRQVLTQLMSMTLLGSLLTFHYCICRSLRSQHAEIEEKKAQIQQRQRVVMDAMGSKGRGHVSDMFYKSCLLLSSTCINTLFSTETAI